MNSVSRKQNYRYLRNVLNGLGMKDTDLCKPTGLSASAISQRFAGRQPWTMTQMYAVMDYLQIPHKLLHVCFPADISEEVAA